MILYTIEFSNKKYDQFLDRLLQLLIGLTHMHYCTRVRQTVHAIISVGHMSTSPPTRLSRTVAMYHLQHGMLAGYLYKVLNFSNTLSILTNLRTPFQNLWLKVQPLSSLSLPCLLKLFSELAGSRTVVSHRLNLSTSLCLVGLKSPR